MVSRHWEQPGGGDRMQTLDIRRALAEPSAIFDTPEQVLADPRLDWQAKYQVLKQWERDAAGDDAAGDDAGSDDSGSDDSGSDDSGSDHAGAGTGLVEEVRHALRALTGRDR